MRGRSRTDWWGVVLEAPDPHALADFYSYLLGWPVAVTEPTGAAIQVPGTSSYLSFDSAPDYVPPVWPAAETDSEAGTRVTAVYCSDDPADTLKLAVPAIVLPPLL